MRVADMIIVTVIFICALAAACGFFMRKRWALRFELLVALGIGLGAALERLVPSRPIPIMRLIGEIAILLILVAPMLEVSRLRRSVVFDPACAHTLRATTHIKAWPKLSRRLTLILLTLVVSLAVLVVLAGT